ncbi:MAG TPA: carbon-nitrogen hydrolase family protein [Thermoleophilaceae bacterium]|nr:carbon-nitrogen hydrolase family protein [Thermoleophilaceae bacterium]
MLTVAAAQPACVALDVAANAEAHADAVRAARARLVVFPEMSLTGYELDAPDLDPASADLEPLVRACAETGTLALAGAPVAGRHIATLAVDGAGARVAYRKRWLGGEEVGRFEPGDPPTAIDVDGLRVGLGICKDTGVDEHVEGAAALGLDLYVAGVCHLPGELAEQDRRGARIARACAAPVALAGFAGPTGWGYEATAGTSTIWSADGSVAARTGADPGDFARAFGN